MCGQEQRELGLTPEENRENAGLFCSVFSTLSYKQDGRWEHVGRMEGGEAVVLQQQQTADSWRTARVHLIS